MDQNGKMFEWAITLSGPALLAYAMVLLVRTQRLVGRSREAEGEVVRLERSGGGRYATVDYAPVFRFAAMDGKTYTVTSGMATHPAGYAVGERVRVLYDPAHPGEARIGTFAETWGGAVLLGIAGIAVLGAGIYLLGRP